MLAGCFAAKAQYNGKDDPRLLGDRAFNNKDYFEAAFYYKKAAQGLSILTEQAIPYNADNNKVVKAKPNDFAYICYRLGESYREYENYLEAEPWYYRVLNGNFEAKYPLTRLWYGVCLRANQHFDESIKQLEQFNLAYKGDNRYKLMAQKEIRNCRFAKEQYQYPLFIDVEKRKGGWNSDGSDYAVIQRDGNSYYTSSRLAKDDKKHLNRVYMVTGNGAPQMIDFKDDNKIKEVEYGTPAFSPDGQKMYYTRWYKNGKNYVHGIYYSKLENGQWGAPQKLNANVNADGFSAKQPFITPDGKRLFFVSNKPGGQGGDDIWVSDMGSDGNPVNSSNLGSTINTPSNEQAPYYSIAEKRLIYSSKGFLGLGGFDFFESYNNANKWTSPQNMGYPMNAAKDDLYYMPDPANPNRFYISSDRESDCCLNLFEVTDHRYIITGSVSDCNTQKPLPGVKVSFIDSITNQTIKQMVLGKTARYSFAVHTRRAYKIMFEKAGYFNKVIPVPAPDKAGSDTLRNPAICLQGFKVSKPIIIKNVEYDFNSATLRPESKQVLNGLATIMKDNPKIKVEIGSHTDSKGTTAYNKKLSQTRAQACVDYIISMGIKESRIYAKGYGESKPIAPNTLRNGKDNPAGRQLNRRTEFTVLKLQ